jgi:hypothetical protein
LLPFLGIVLNGTSSILYGTLPELARKGELGRAFALFSIGNFPSSSDNRRRRGIVVSDLRRRNA